MALEGLERLMGVEVDFEVVLEFEALLANRTPPRTGVGVLMFEVDVKRALPRRYEGALGTGVDCLAVALPHAAALIHVDQPVIRLRLTTSSF